MSEPKMNGQWIGRFGGSTPGRMVLNIDETASSYEGMAFLFNDDASLPGTAASFSAPDKNDKFQVKTKVLLALDPKNLQPVPFDQIQPRFGQFSQFADVTGTMLDGACEEATRKKLRFLAVSESTKKQQLADAAPGDIDRLFDFLEIVSPRHAHHFATVYDSLFIRLCYSSWA